MDKQFEDKDLAIRGHNVLYAKLYNKIINKGI